MVVGSALVRFLEEHPQRRRRGAGAMAEERDVKPPASGDAKPSVEIDRWRRRIDVIDEPAHEPAQQPLRLRGGDRPHQAAAGAARLLAGARGLDPGARDAGEPGPLDATAVRRVFERIIDESRRLERLAADGPEPARPKR